MRKSFFKFFALSFVFMVLTSSLMAFGCGCNGGMKKDYDVLYHFKGQNIDLVEVAKTNLPETTAKDKVYFWLVYNQTENKVARLEFESMGNDWRKFKDSSYLKFGSSKGTLTMGKKDFDLNQVALMNKSFAMNDQKLSMAVESYLKNI